MALPAINIRVDANTTDAERGLNRVDDALERVGTQARTTGAAAANMGSRLAVLGNMSGSTRAKVQQVSFQVQDLAVQLAGGTRASTALAQQLPQLASAFGAVGSVVGVVAAVGIPALAYAFFDAANDADRLSDALEDVERTTDRLQEPLEVLELSAGELADRFGRLAENVRLFAIAQAEARLGQAMGGLAESASFLRDVTREYEVFEVQLGSTGQWVEKLSGDLRGMQKELGLTDDQTRMVAQSFREFEAASTSEEQSAALKNILEMFKEMDVQLSKLPPELLAAIDAMATFEIATASATRATERLANAVANVTTGTPLYELGLGGDDLIPGAAGGTKPSGGARGGGGGGRSAGNHRLTRLIEDLQTERETLEIWYAESLELLNSANATELEAIGGHNEAKLRLEQEYQDRLRGLRSGYSGDALSQAGQFFGDMASAMQSGNEKMLRIAKVFGAAQSMINSYQAYTEVLKDPTLPWFARIPAAVGVLSAGLGMVSAIKGVNAGGAAGGGAVGTAANANVAPNVSRLVTVQFAGEGDTISRKGAIDMINAINEAVEDGARIRVTS